jgi:hypothetical protein
MPKNPLDPRGARRHSMLWSQQRRRRHLDLALVALLAELFTG